MTAARSISTATRRATRKSSSKAFKTPEATLTESPSCRSCAFRKTSLRTPCTNSNRTKGEIGSASPRDSIKPSARSELVCCRYSPQRKLVSGNALTRRPRNPASPPPRAHPAPGRPKSAATAPERPPKVRHPLPEALLNCSRWRKGDATNAAKQPPAQAVAKHPTLLRFQLPCSYPHHAHPQQERQRGC